MAPPWLWLVPRLACPRTFDPVHMLLVYIGEHFRSVTGEMIICKSSCHVWALLFFFFFFKFSSLFDLASEQVGS